MQNFTISIGINIFQDLRSLVKVRYLNELIYLYILSSPLAMSCPFILVIREHMIDWLSMQARL